MPKYNAVNRTNPGRVKIAFMQQVLRETAEEIREKQNAVVNEWSLFDEGNLQQMLQGHFSVNASDNGANLSMRYLVYARYLDMADPRRKVKKEGYSLYNRIIFGILYNKTMPRMKYGFTNEVKQKITNELVNAVGQLDRNAAALYAKSQRVGYR